MMVLIHHGLYNPDETKEDSNNDSDFDNAINTDDESDFSNPEEQRQLKLRAIQSAQRKKKGEKKENRKD